MNLDHLKQLVTFKQQGTLSKASQVLLISQPALTRSMKKLEEELNIPIFERRKNKLELTETGEYVVKQAEMLLNKVDDFKEDIQQFYERHIMLMGGICAPGPAFELEARLGARFKELIRLEQKDIDGLQEGLLKKEYDFVITDTPLEDKVIYYESYFKEVLYLTIPMDHPLKDKQVIHLEDLKGLTMLLRTKLGIWDQFIAQLEDTNFILQENYETFDQLAKASDLPIFTTNITVEHGLVKFYRKHIPIEEEHASVTFYVNVLKENKEYLDYLK